LATASPLVDVFSAPTEGAGVGELFDLKKSARVFFGEGDGATLGDASDFFFRSCFAGEAEASGAADGEASAAAFALRPFFGLGDGDASVEAAGEAPVSAVAVAFLCDLCLAGEAEASGEADASGDCA